jgi:chromosome segregation ATPase
MLNNITESYNRKIAKLNQDFQELKNSQIQKINEVYSHLQEAIKKAGTDVHNKFSNEMNDIKQKSDEKNRQDADGIERLNTLEKEVNQRQKRLEKKTEELKQLKVKIKQNNEDWDQKNESLKHEKEKIMNSYRILKTKLIEFRNMQHEKLKKLVKNSWECETKLKNYIKLAEKILKLAEISRRLEIDKEKILPYYENSDVEKDDENVVPVKLDEIKGIDPMIYEEIESLQNFWKRYNKVKLDVIAIKKQKEEVEKQNEILKNYLQQYYDGFHVNNVVMTNENPLLKIDKMNPNPRYYVVEENGTFDNTYQEGNKIVCETRKQKLVNYVHAH